MIFNLPTFLLRLKLINIAEKKGALFYYISLFQDLHVRHKECRSLALWHFTFFQIWLKIVLAYIQDWHEEGNNNFISLFIKVFFLFSNYLLCINSLITPNSYEKVMLVADDGAAENEEKAPLNGSYHFWHRGGVGISHFQKWSYSADICSTFKMEIVTLIYTLLFYLDTDILHNDSNLGSNVSRRAVPDIPVFTNTVLA